MTVTEYVELGVQAATVIALLIAGWQLWESRKSTSELVKIKESLATRFLGHFPDYNGEIAEIISKAKAEVVILCDVPGYGVFSEPLAWSNIVSSIQGAIGDRIPVQLYVYNDERIRDMIKEQGFDGLDLERFKKRLGLTDEEFTEDIALEASVEMHRSIIQRDFSECSVERLEERIPLYFWMIDGREAILAIPTYDEGITEYGFYTSDQSLLQALRSMVARMARPREEGQ